MEEQVGYLWHRLVTRAAGGRHPEAAVQLTELAPTLGILFRALGGDGGLRVEGANATAHGARRSWLARLAGTGSKAELAWRDDQSLRLPPRIDLFPDPALNRDLYLWLAALAAGDTGHPEPWATKGQRLTLAVLEQYPGLRSRYERLVTAHIKARPDPAGMAPDQAAQEWALRQALQHPGSLERLPVARRAPWPVPLWLHPSPPRTAPAAGDEAGGGEADGRSQALKDQRRREGKRTELSERRGGLVTLRMENILTWGEPAALDRGSEENPDLDQAAQAADEMERLHLARDQRRPAARLRFDLDLPSAACDDQVLGEGELLPEWDWKSQTLRPDQCRVLPLAALAAPPVPLPDHLHALARRLRAQFQQLQPGRVWRRGQPDGAEIDLDAYLRFAAERASGARAGAEGLYRDPRRGARDLACLLLADLSLSTDTWLNNQHRIIDVIRDSLFLFAESLAATGDRFALYGFSSRKRDPIRFHEIKTFDQPHGAQTRGRIQAIKPGYYTRMGAALRQGTRLLGAEGAARRLLLLLSDGKPNDIDHYEGRHGIEDTRQAVREARHAGLQPFCVTVDQKGNDYLPYLFGSGGYLVIRQPQELPRKLPLLYARLTRD